ncbi:dihydropteroate synthase [Litoreibacter janthinus]|uniref:Dihydropteroate synthase n=1 Tax=Litoreibacter janthinus TaxID=670154 RepID=A0A1I6HDU7_9RHOB|nr:dihydropteroate synthase [Litoreibacter janthinus]SFR52666.1 Dihydropteroate synthase [Litoreibacter janthinus]
MTLRFRPIIQADLKIPADAVPLHGGPLWFDRVEPLERGATHALMPARDLPSTLLDALSAPHLLPDLPKDRPAVMGVLNITPDSFSDGGKFIAPQDAIARAQAMGAKGADILDIGGESTRPGAALVPEAEEVARTAPVISALRAAGVSVPISIDTRKAAVAEAALSAGANMLNDVSAMTFDDAMAATAARSGAPICLMHAQGDPATMQNDPHYDNVLLDVYDYLAERVAAAQAAGIAKDRIIVDPGVGFGKTQAHNLTLIRGLSLFHTLGCPILLGVSRKRFIGNISGVERAEDRAFGSVSVALEGVRQGVQIIRAHDIEAHRQAFALWQAIHT